MADLDFSHHVEQVPQQEAIPTVKRSVTAEVTGSPNYQAGISQYAENTNWMSNIGSAVAAKASEAIARKLGAEAGKNPRGDLGIPLTDADKVFNEAYQTQSQATLGLQANKLITDSNLETAKATRITPALIAKTNEKVMQGLNNIIQNAPANVKPHLEYQYGNLMLAQNEELNKRMFSEQREDMRNNAILSAQIQAEHAFTFAAQGKYKEAEHSVQSVKDVTSGSSALRVLTPAQARTFQETAALSAKKGKAQYEYMQALSQGKGEEYLKNLADKGDRSDPDYMEVSNYVLQVANQQHALRQENEALNMATFDNALYTNMDDAAKMLPQLQTELSPVNYQKVLLKYNQALKKNQASQQEMALLNNGFGNPEIFARVSDDVKNKAFDDKVRYLYENAKKNGKSVSVDEAEAMVASQASGVIPNFVKGLEGKFRSLDPNVIEGGVHQIDYMYRANKGENLAGLSEKAKVFAVTYNNLKRSYPADMAAQMAHEQIFNVKPETHIIEQKWNKFTKELDNSPQGKLGYYSNLAGIDANQLSDPLAFQDQAETLLESYYYTSHGNLDFAKDAYIRDIKTLYGESYINGKKQVTFFPIEKILGLPTSEYANANKFNLEIEGNLTTLPQRKELDFIFNKLLNHNITTIYSATGLIQEDMIENVNKQLEPIKKEYEQGKSLFYFEIEPRHSIEWSVKNKNNYDRATEKIDNIKKYSEGSPIIIHRVWQNGVRETYTLNVKASPSLTPLSNGAYVGGWDVILVDEKGGYQNLTRLLPSLNKHVTYRPETEKIRSKYMKYYHGV